MFQRSRIAGIFAFAAMLIAFSVNARAEEQKSLYDRLGGEPAIKAVVDEFVTLAASDPAVNFTRKGTDREWQATPENVDQLKKHLVQFVSIASGATDVQYEGGDMKSVHEGMKIKNAEFDAIAADLNKALDKFNVPQAEKDELLGIVGTTRAQMVEE